jgi:hypothetical protein
MACRFCGSKKTLTAEHVYPQWCQPLLSHSSGDEGTHRSVTLRVGEAPKPRSYKGHPATQTVRAFCAGCNNGWMSQLESAAKPRLTAMIEGRTQTLTRADQEVIAAWWVKTALVAGSKFNPGLTPEFYEQFHRDRAPSATTHVRLAEVAYREQHYVDFRPLRVVQEAEQAPLIPNAYSAVLAVGEVAAFVVGWLDRKPSLREALRQFGRGLVLIWPPREHDVVWPPLGGAFDHEALDALADSVVRFEDVAAGRPRPNA